jgi:hypothetical protein
MNALVSLSHERRGISVSICRQGARVGFVGSINEMDNYGVVLPPCSCGPREIPKIVNDIHWPAD